MPRAKTGAKGGSDRGETDYKNPAPGYPLVEWGLSIAKPLVWKDYLVTGFTWLFQWQGLKGRTVMEKTRWILSYGQAFLYFGE